MRRKLVHCHPTDVIVIAGVVEITNNTVRGVSSLTVDIAANARERWNRETPIASRDNTLLRWLSMYQTAWKSSGAEVRH
jgi:uridine kinase